jgi:hypothetical protein
MLGTKSHPEISTVSVKHNAVNVCRVKPIGLGGGTTPHIGSTYMAAPVARPDSLAPSSRHPVIKAMQISSAGAEKRSSLDFIQPCMVPPDIANVGPLHRYVFLHNHSQCFNLV